MVVNTEGQDACQKPFAPMFSSAWLRGPSSSEWSVSKRYLIRKILILFLFCRKARLFIVTAHKTVCFSHALSTIFAHEHNGRTVELLNMEKLYLQCCWWKVSGRNVDDIEIPSYPKADLKEAKRPHLLLWQGPVRYYLIKRCTLISSSKSSF